ncbi:hypothetical protein Pyn_27279 [Prunus yedoensis var. nudiflora]|uniref:Uncharacterized protein n=1 Tax=Prunus yedoensis var. nudiflora TaxID=2094558 RepID=A0A314XSH7_PRUYE|nr:hypothetical protein Pyn_27279 [Prunus yedoensis var. nudiflora]
MVFGLVEAGQKIVVEGSNKDMRGLVKQEMYECGEGVLWIALVVPRKMMGREWWGVIYVKSGSIRFVFEYQTMNKCLIYFSAIDVNEKSYFCLLHSSAAVASSNQCYFYLL